MTVTEQIAKHLRDVYFGGNWTACNLRDKLADVTWQQATTKVHALHSIAELVYHINYFDAATLQVLRGGPLDAHDKFSFDCPAIRSAEDWERLLQKTWADAEGLAAQIERLPEDQLDEYFMDKKYGSYYRCLQGLVEHCHYHLGQISMIKTILQHQAETGTTNV